MKLLLGCIFKLARVSMGSSCRMFLGFCSHQFSQLSVIGGHLCLMALLYSGKTVHPL